MKNRLILVLFAVAAAAAAWAQLPVQRGGAFSRNPLKRISSSRNNAPAGAPAKSEPANPEAVASASAAEDPQGTAPADLNFKDAPLDMVLEVYGKLVGKTVLKDPHTPNATINLQSRPGQKLSKEDQIEAIEAVLEMNDVHFEPYGEKFVRALNRATARQDGIPLLIGKTSGLPDSAKVASVMLDFKNIPVEEAQKALEGFKSKSGLLQVFERTNKILVTDLQLNINRMIEISQAIDTATPVLENVYVRQIKNAVASDIKIALEQIVTESQKEQDKNGKTAQNTQPSTRLGSLSAGPSPMLLRPRTPGVAQPAPAANVESLVTSVSDADRGMIRGKVLIIADERSNKLIIVTMKSNMDFFDKVIEQLDVETTPDVQVKVYRLKYAEAEDVAAMINDLIGNSASSKSNAKQAPGATGGTNANLTRNSPNAAPTQRTVSNQRTGEAKAGELSKENVTVLADKRINGLVVMARTEDIPAIEQIIESMDIKLSQVLIETAIIEIALGDDLSTGIEWVQKGKNDDFWNRGQGYMLGGGGGSAGETLLKNMFTVASTAVSNVTEGASSGINPIGSGVTYLLKSDRLNLGAVIKASKSDNRAKYIASPIIMTVDNKEATIDATEARKFFNGYETSSSYSTYVRTPKYDSKDIGIKIKVKPKINPNGTVMLNIEEEYSQLGAGQSVLVDNGSTVNVDTSLMRKMTADILLDNRQSVVLGGLTERYDSTKETGIPILKDIPILGKWLFGSVTRSEARKELLVFMTPYVLDDAESAQAEAIRRKRSLSDITPWDVHGWSDSELADKMSRKEMLRRLKEEADKQDEDRRNRLATEKWKLERARRLEAMDEEERKFWLEEHKEELEHEMRMKKKRDEEEQESLKKVIESINSKPPAAAPAAEPPVKEAK